MQHDMLFLRVNSNMPFGQITSTARKGRKWFDKVKIGDILTLRYTEDNAEFGGAVVVKVELVSFGELIASEAENHATQTGSDLRKDLLAAYGAECESDEWTMVHFVCTWAAPKQEASR